MYTVGSLFFGGTDMKVKLPLLVAAAAAGYFGVMYRSGRSGLHPLTRAKQGQTRVACVGDSITYGHGTTRWPDRTYPMHLSRMLGKGYHVNNFGFNGRTVNPDCADAYAATKLFTQSTQYRADILVFMMGTNDTKPRNWRGAEAFHRDLLQMLDCYPEAKCILCTPAAAFYKEGAAYPLAEYEIQPELVDTIAEIVRQVAAERSCELLDIHSLTKENPQWYIKDRIHPNDQGAESIARAVAESIRRGEQ